MTSTTPRIISVALATLAIAAPAATAMPLRDNGDIRTSSLAGTTSAQPYQDLRNPDQQAPAAKPSQDLRNPDNRVVPAVPSDLPQTMKPVVLTQPQPVADDGGPSPLIFVAPSLVLVTMLGAAFIYTRSARRPARV
jgi:hypothetical protein